MVEVLGIIIYRRPKGKPHKMESQTIDKIGCVSILIKKIKDKRISNMQNATQYAKRRFINHEEAYSKDVSFN